MKVVEKKECNCNCNREELDFLSEKCLSLAEDIIDLDEDIEGLADWTHDFTDNYNSMLDTVDYNFDILDERTKQIDEVIDKHNSLAEWVSDLDFHKKLLWGSIAVNFILTLLLIFNVL